MSISKYFSFTFVIFLSSCLSAGTHGSIKSYKFPVPKSLLDTAVKQVISSNRNITRSTTKAWNDTTQNDYYNDGRNYITFTIKGNVSTIDYTLQFVGTEQDWDTSKASELSIAYAWDNDGNGGSEGRGNFPWYKFKLRKKVTSLLENEFLTKVDSILGKKHRDAD
jgi:hypothetical protein